MERLRTHASDRRSETAVENELGPTYRTEDSTSVAARSSADEYSDALAHAVAFAFCHLQTERRPRKTGFRRRRPWWVIWTLHRCVRQVVYPSREVTRGSAEQVRPHWMDGYGRDRLVVASEQHRGGEVGADVRHRVLVADRRYGEF